MADDERVGIGDAERESRFVNLLQPNRDMATNWSVDVGKQLEGYLDELKATGLFDDGNSPLNFAEAALLIQGSIQVYSRKVEYLYNLVVRALDYLAQKKQGQEGETPSSQENDQGCDSADETEGNFLNLDDEVNEEAHIDILDEDGLDSRSQPMKVPPSLLVTESESLDMSGEAGEVASYYVATCTMYRNFLLLDPSDTATVDKYLSSEENIKGECGKDSAVPSSSTPRGSGEHDPREFSAAPSENNVKTPGRVQTPGGMDMGEADWQCDGDEEMTGYDPHVEEDYTKYQTPVEDQGPSTEAPTSSNPVAQEKDPYIDPWVLLNPHEPGTLPVKPFKKGSTQRSLKPRRDGCSPAFVTKHFGLFFPEFAKALQTKERHAKTRRRGVEPSDADHARSFYRDSDGQQTVQTPLDPLYDVGLGGEFGDSDHEYSAYDDFEEGHHFDGGNEDPAPPVDTPEKQDIHYQEKTPFSPHQDSPNVELRRNDENMSLEDFCRAHVDSILQKLAESQVRSGLTARVTTWKNKIEATLKDDESLPPFDIHEYGDRLLARLSTSAATSRNQEETQDADESFTNLVNGQPKDEVARSFSALLQLVNSGNVTIDKGFVGSGSYCFSAENAFRVRLLNSQNRRNEMFQHMVPPQNVSKTTGQRKVSQQTLNSGLSERLSSPVVSNPRTPRSGLRVGSATAFMSPSSLRKSSRKRGQSAAGKVGGVMDSENRGFGTSDKGYTPVKLTPNRRRSKRKPMQTIQA